STICALPITSLAPAARAIACESGLTSGLTSHAPIFYTVPLQLLAYHVALIKGTDVDQPRNLAASDFFATAS
ncbi:hypothetical protein, partial [Klebsiella pneumoniae]|uniref:hypothetical protein n=1 Tax=Klebsiella pneumoniae TaxID=573 RepID=UPI00210BDFB5